MIYRSQKIGENSFLDMEELEKLKKMEGRINSERS